LSGQENNLDFYAGVDGTGVGNDAQYAKDFTDSYVNQLYRSSRFDVRYYLRGPTWEGGTAKALSKEMLREMETRIHQKGGRQVGRLILAGYSRGGAIAIRIARELGKHGHKVHCLLLYDAVDMSLAIAAKQIPANVRYCFHAMRDPASRSRTSWGNCGTEREAKDDKVTYFRWRRFMCTHGGMGGTPWSKADSDGIINEALTGPETTSAFAKVQGNLGYQVLRATPFGLGGGAIIDGAGAANSWHRNSSRTSITLRQDRDESRQVGIWMMNKLDWALKQQAAPVLVG
jgi:pimeloyl-ACP methyl ester carboxylesterase